MDLEDVLTMKAHRRAFEDWAYKKDCLRVVRGFLAAFVDKNSGELRLELDTMNYQPRTDGKTIWTTVMDFELELPEEHWLTFLMGNTVHECGHINSSNFSDMEEVGKWYGKYMQEQWKKAGHTGSIAAAAQEIGHSILNAVEDGRIEAIQVHNHPGVYKALYFSNMIMRDRGVIEKKAKDQKEEYSHFFNCVLCYAKTGMYPEGAELYAGTPLEDTILQLSPLIDAGVKAISSQDCRKVVEEMLEKAAPYLIRLLESEDLQQEQKQNGSKPREYTGNGEREYNSPSSSNPLRVDHPEQHQNQGQGDQQNQQGNSQGQSPSSSQAGTNSQGGSQGQTQNSTQGSNPQQNPSNSQGKQSQKSSRNSQVDQQDSNGSQGEQGNQPQQGSDNSQSGSGGDESQNNPQQSQNGSQQPEGKEGSQAGTQKDAQQGDEKSDGGSSSNNSQQDPKQSESGNSDKSPAEGSGEKKEGEKQDSGTDGDSQKSEGSDGKDQKDGESKENTQAGGKSEEKSDDKTGDQSDGKNHTEGSNGPKNSGGDNQNGGFTPQVAPPKKGFKEAKRDVDPLDTKSMEEYGKLLSKFADGVRQVKEKEQTSQGAISQKDLNEIRSKFAGATHEVSQIPLKIRGTSPLPPVYKKQADELRREIKRVLAEHHGDQRGLKRGSLDVKNVWKYGFNDSRLFMKKSNEELGSAAFYLLIDNSGSTMAKAYSVDGVPVRLYQAERAAAGVIEEASMGMIPCKVTLFHTDGYRAEHTIIRDFKDQSRTNRSWNSVREILPDGCNTDALHIRIASLELLKRREHKKVLFILSDGQPSSFGSRTSGDIWATAQAEVHAAVQDARKKGVVVIPIMLGDEDFFEDAIGDYQKMYGKNIVKCLPQQLTTKLSRLFREIISG